MINMFFSPPAIFPGLLRIKTPFISSAYSDLKHIKHYSVTCFSREPEPVAEVVTGFDIPAGPLKLGAGVTSLLVNSRLALFLPGAWPRGGYIWTSRLNSTYGLMNTALQ